MQQNYIIKVRVCDPVVKEGHPNYISYTVIGEDKLGSFEVSKRYSNFCELRDKWVQSWPGCYIPSLPQKMFKGNFDNTKIAERMKMLDHFLNQIILQPHLWYSEEMNCFLRENDHTLVKPSLLQRYHQAFPELKEYQVDENLDIKIEQFHLFLVNARPILINFKERLKLHKKISAECSEQMNIFFDFFLPQYEDLFIRQYTSKDNLPYTQSIQQKDILQNKQQKEVNEFLLQIRFEINEQKSFIKMIEDRNAMQKKEEDQRNQLKSQVDDLGRIQNGKFGLWKLYTNQESYMNENLVTLKSIENELRETCLILEMINKIISKQIDHFKLKRQQIYRNTVRDISNYFKNLSIKVLYHQFRIFNFMTKFLSIIVCNDYSILIILMYNNFFNPFFVSSDIQLIQTNFKTTLKSAMEDQNEQNIKQVIALIRCLNLALDIPPLAQELTNNYNAQNLLEIAQIKLAKFITTEYGNELQLLLHKLQSDNRKPSPHNILEIMLNQNEEVLYIYIRLLRIQLLYFDVNRQQAYDYYFFFKETAIPSQLYEEFIQFIMKELMILPKEYKDRFIDILIYLNRQSQEISEQLLKKEIIDQFLLMCNDPLYTKRCLIIIRDLLETSEDIVIEVESTSEILFNLLRASKDNKQIVQLISQIISKIQPQQYQQQQQQLSINDNQMLEDQIDQICFSMLQQTFEYDVQFVDQLIQIIYKEDCSENIYLSTSFLIEKYLADMNSPQRTQISEASYKLIIQSQNPRVCQAYLQLLHILNTQYKLSIKIEFLDTMRDLYQDNMKILRQLDDLQRKKKKKFNKFNNQDFESIESFTQFSMNRSMQIRKSSQGPNRSEQEDNELDQIIKLTFKKDDLFVTVDCFKYLLEAQKVNQDIVLQYLEQIIDVFLLYPLENTIRELAITLFDTINPQEFIAHMVQDIESYDEYTLKLIAGLSLFSKYFDYYIIEKILNFMLQFIIMKIEGSHLNYILIICYNLNLKQPQLIHYIYSIVDKNQSTPIKCEVIALAILYKQKYQADITKRIQQLQEQLIEDLEEDRFYSQNSILLEQYINLLSIQKDKSMFVQIVKQHLQYIQYENVSIDRRLMILTIIRQLIMQTDFEIIITQTPYLFITFYILKNSNDYLQIHTNLIFTDRFTGYYQTLSTIILANQQNILISEMFILQFLNQTVENTIQSFQLLENKFLIPTLIFIHDTISIFDHQFLLPLLQSLIDYACEFIVSTSVLIPIWQILLMLFDQPPVIEYYQTNYPNNKLPEIGFKRDKQLADLTILLLKKLAVDENQIQMFQQLAIEQNIIKEVEEEQNLIQEELNKNQYNQQSPLKYDNSGVVYEQNQKNDEYIVAALVGQQQLEEELIREEVMQEEQQQRQDNAVLATAIVADREMRIDDNRHEDRDIDRAERRQDEVLATAIIANREIQQNERQQEDRQIDRAERRQDEVLATAIIADRGIQQNDRRQDDQQIDRAERRQDEVLATAIVADREIQQNERRQEDRQIDRVEKRDNVSLIGTLGTQNQDANLTPTLTGEATINKEGDWEFQNLYDIATALDLVIGNNQLMNKFNLISQAIKIFITNEQQALNCHQIHILNKLLILQQTEETQKCIQQILQFKKSSKMSENLIQWQLIKITEINLQILSIFKSTNQIDSMIARLIGQKEIIPLINSLETISDLRIIKSIFECLDAYCISERVANFFGQYNIVFYVEKWINIVPVEVYLLIGSLCLSNKLQSNFIEKKIYENILRTIIGSKEVQLLCNSFYGLSGLCYESPISLEIFSLKLNDIMLDLICKQCEPTILQTMCAFISNLTYKNDKFKQQMRIFIAPLMNQIQRQNQVLVIQQILRAISNLIYIKENAQIADNQKILEITKPLLSTPQCICDLLNLYSNLGAHQYLKKEIVIIVIDLIQRNLDKTNILSCALDTLNIVVSQYSGFILEHAELILDLTTQTNQEIVFKTYRLISNLVPKNREFFLKNNIIGKLSLHNNTKIDHYYNKIVQILNKQQTPKLVAPKLLENPYDKLHNGYSIIFFREDGSSIFCELKITTNKEIFAVQADGYMNEKYRIRFLMEMNFNVLKSSREYQICSKNSLFKYQQFFVLKGKEHNNKNINVIQGQVMSVSLKQELYEVLSLIFK